MSKAGKYAGAGAAILLALPGCRREVTQQELNDQAVEAAYQKAWDLYSEGRGDEYILAHDVTPVKNPAGQIVDNVLLTGIAPGIMDDEGVKSFCIRYKFQNADGPLDTLRAPKCERIPESDAPASPSPPPPKNKLPNNERTYSVRNYSGRVYGVFTLGA